MKIEVGRNPDAKKNQYNPLQVLEQVGLNLSGFKGKILDVGCGRKARTVFYLKQKEIDAEGVDLELAVQAPHLMQADVSDRIPRQDNNYDFAYSNLSVFKDGMASIQNAQTQICGYNFYENLKWPLLYTLDEVMRVLKPGSSFAVWPFPGYFVERDAWRLNHARIKVEKQRVEKGMYAEDLSHIDDVSFQFPGETGTGHRFDMGIWKDEFMHRAVFTKS